MRLILIIFIFTDINLFSFDLKFRNFKASEDIQMDNGYILHVEQIEILDEYRSVCKIKIIKDKEELLCDKIMATAMKRANINNDEIYFKIGEIMKNKGIYFVLSVTSFSALHDEDFVLYMYEYDTDIKYFKKCKFLFHYGSNTIAGDGIQYRLNMILNRDKIISLDSRNSCGEKLMVSICNKIENNVFDCKDYMVKDKKAGTIKKDDYYPNGTRIDAYGLLKEVNNGDYNLIEGCK